MTDWTPERHEAAKRRCEILKEGQWYVMAETGLWEVMAEADLPGALMEIERLEAENAQLRGVLRRLEWCREISLSQYCPICHTRKGEGHLDDCELAALLQEKEP